MQNSSSGNVLFLILIAVALFAALSYAVTQTSRGGGANASREKVMLVVNQIEQFKSSLTSGMTRLTVNGCSPEQINLSVPSKTNAAPASPYSTAATIGSTCDLFSSNGGGVIIPFAETTGLLRTYFNTPNALFSIMIFGYADRGAGSSSPDLYVQMVYDSVTPGTFTQTLCAEINQRQGVPAPTDSAGISAMMTGGRLTTDLFCDATAGNLYMILRPN